MYDKTTFLSGMAMGLTGKGNPTFEASDTFTKGYLVGAALRRKRMLPVAYLYNGVKLPSPISVLTEKVLEFTPHGHLFYVDGVYRLVYTNAKYKINSVGLFATGLNYYYFVDTIMSDDGWSTPYNHSLTANKISYTYISVYEEGFTVDNLIWASYDIIDVRTAESYVYLAASDPIPVYE